MIHSKPEIIKSMLCLSSSSGGEGGEGPVLLPDLVVILKMGDCSKGVAERNKTVSERDLCSWCHMVPSYAL